MQEKPYHAKFKVHLPVGSHKPVEWHPGNGSAKQPVNNETCAKPAVRQHSVQQVDQAKPVPVNHVRSVPRDNKHYRPAQRPIPQGARPPAERHVAKSNAVHTVEKTAHAHSLPRVDAAPQVFPDAEESGRGEITSANGAFALLLPQIQRAVSEEGYNTPTPIQEKTISHVLGGKDILGCAQTGTGKTAAFTLPLLQYLTSNHRHLGRGMPRVLILAPTRELAAQIGDSISTYGRYLHIKHAVIYGGVGQFPQVKALEQGVDILVATPGRLLDLMNQRHVRLSSVEVFILDEADRMLDMGFINDIRKVIAVLPVKRQSLFFSATLTRDALELARTMVHNAVHVTVTPEQPTVERIVQKVMFVEKADKDRLLVDLLRDAKIDKVLVFTRMKHLANRVVDGLKQCGITAAAIHADKSQTDRTKALAGFKAGKVRVLVATDIAARGIDVDRITHVINYNLPNEPETYVHRIGRTARAGAEGDAISFCCAEDRDFLRDIERLIKKSVPVDVNHPYHSDAARNATGAAARPAPRQQRGQGQRQGRGRSQQGYSANRKSWQRGHGSSR